MWNRSRLHGVLPGATIRQRKHPNQSRSSGPITFGSFKCFAKINEGLVSVLG